MSTIPSTDVAPEEVADFLAASTGQGTAEVPIAAAGNIELPQEALELLADNQPGDTAAPKRVNVPMDEDIHPAQTTQDRWSREDWQFGKISVSPLERDAYFRAALMEQGVSFDIEIHNVPMTVRDLCGYENRVVDQALFSDQIESAFKFTGEQLGFRRTIYKMVMMITEVNGVQSPHYVEFNPDSANDVEASATLLRASAKLFEAKLHPARHSLLLAGLRIFDYKITICHEGLANGDFIRPAGIA